LTFQPPLVTLLAMGRAILYIRVSTEDQVAGTSLATQEEACRAAAARGGFEVASVFRDEGESARTTDRPGLMAALAAARKKDANALIVYKIDRLSRNQLDFLTIKTALLSWQVQLISATEPMTEDPAGRLTASLLAAIAQFDNEVRGARARSGMEARAKAGGWVWVAPLGFENARSQAGGPTLTLDTIRAEKLRPAWSWALAGVPLAEIAARLEAAGLKPARNGQLTGRTVWRMLRSPVYAGMMKTRLADGRMMRGDWPAIVDAETWWAVQEKLEGKAQARPRVTDRDDLPLRGWVRCGSCGRPLTGSWSRGRRGGRYAYYHCHERCRGVNVRADRLEAMLLEALDGLALRPEAAKIIREEGIRVARERELISRTAKNASAQEAAHLTRQQDRLLDLYLAGHLDADAYHNRAGKIAVELLKARDRAEAAAVEHADYRAMIDEALALVEHPRRWWQASTLKERRAIGALFFPSPPIFDGEACRTPVINEAVLLYTQHGLDGSRWHATLNELGTLMHFFSKAISIAS